MTREDSTGSLTHSYSVSESQFLRDCGISRTEFRFIHDGGVSVGQENCFGSHEVFLSRDDILMLYTLMRNRERAGIFEGTPLDSDDWSWAVGGGK